MKNMYCIILVLALCFLCSCGCGPDKSELLEKGGIWEVYVRECVKCHKTSGTGGFLGRLFFNVPDFTDAKWQDNVSDSRLIIHVANGFRKMPGYKDKLKDEEIVDVVKICVRSFYPPIEQEY